MDWRVRVVVPFIVDLLPVGIVSFGPLVTSFLHDRSAEPVCNSEGFEEDVLQSRAVISGLGKRHCVVHGATLEGVPIDVLGKDCFGDARTKDVALNKQSKLWGLEDLPQKNCLDLEIIIGAVSSAKCDVLERSEAEIVRHLGNCNRVPRDKAELGCKLSERDLHHIHVVLSIELKLNHLIAEIEENAEEIVALELKPDLIDAEDRDDLILVGVQPLHEVLCGVLEGVHVI